MQDTPSQRQKATYSPDVVIKIEVEETGQQLLVNFVDDSRLVLAQGETTSMTLWFSNTGTKPINEIWMVAGAEDEIWLSAPDELDDASESMSI